MRTEEPGYFVVAEELIRDKARAYVPLKEKQKFIQFVGGICYEQMNVGCLTKDTATPPVYKEHPILKQKYLAAALLKLYLRVDFTPENAVDPWMMTDEDFDYFCGLRLLSQIERIQLWTGDASLRNKCYDLIRDFIDLREMLNSEIRGLIRAMNDTLARFQMLQAVQAAPEYLADKKEALANVN